MKPSPLLLVLALSTAPLATRAAVIALDAVRDNTIYSETLAALSNGQGPYLYAGRNANDNLRRALFGFDLSAIPAGSTILGARLTLSMDRTISGAFDFSLHRLLQNWGEGASNAGSPGGTGAPAQPGDATWTHALFSGTAWSTPGGTFAATPSATVSVDAIADYAWSSAQMAADVQDWLDDPATNFGWVLQGGESALSAKRFISAEGAASGRPQLEISYQPAIVPEPTPALLLAMLGTAALLRRSPRSLC